MSRLRSQLQDSKIQPEVISQVHDEVVALCLRNYSSIPSIEIDGIICISLLDTKEQQVVKIHKTFKSVVADAAPRKSASARSNAYPNITSILSAGSPASFQDSPREDRSESEEPNFQKDINAISDLLKASDAITGAGSRAHKDKTPVSKRSKRKRKHPKHLPDMLYDTDNIEQDVDKDKHLQSNDRVDSEKEVPKSPSVVIVKQEPVDYSYDANLQASDGPADGTSVSDMNTDNVDQSTAQNDSTEDTVPESVEACDETVKIENTDQDNEYGVESNSNNDGAVANDETNDSSVGTEQFEASENQDEDREWIYPETFDHEGLKLSKRTEDTGKEKHWLYGIAKNQRNDSSSPEIRTNEVTKMALMDKYYQQGSMSQKGYTREVIPREERDPQGRSWIEMVKDNVTKYQAALMRTVNKKQKTQIEEPPPGSASGLLKSLATPRASLLNADHLKALLKEPPMNVEKLKLACDKARDSDPIASSTGSERSRSTSRSPAPVVKIEVDEEPVEEIMDTQNETEDSEKMQESEKPPSGKLESRYPALFNQLQQAKQPGQPTLDQSDSLVNRLPFISFQELFSQANPLPSTTRLSDSATRQLLEQAKINPYPSKANSKTKKSVWKWKKRHVKPKNTTDQNLSETQEQPEAADQDLSEGKPLGIHMSAKKTFAHKKSKGDEGSDHEWTPSVATDEVLLSGDSQEDWGSRKKISTRLSTGEKPRMNFAELENSDIELDDEDFIEEDDSDKPAELLPLFCRNNCGANFSSFTELKMHEDSCMQNSGAVGGAENAAGTSEDFKCRFCGLDFNQEYRWHYHMVKVHRVNAEKTFLFR